MLRYILISLLLFLSLSSWADFKVMQLNHRQAQDIIPLLQPHLSSNAQLTGNAYQLIISASKDDIAKVESLIQSLDTALKQFQIEIRHGELSSIRSERGNTEVHLNSDSQSSVRITRYSTRGRSSENISQSIKALEGYPTYLNTGEMIPNFSFHGPQNYSVITGFYVEIKHMNANQVTLFISQQKQSLQIRRGVKHQGLETRLNVPLNEWFTLGSQRQSQHDRETTGYTTQQSTDNHQSIQIRIQRLDFENQP